MRPCQSHCASSRSPAPDHHASLLRRTAPHIGARPDCAANQNGPRCQSCLERPQIRARAVCHWILDAVLSPEALGASFVLSPSRPTGLKRPVVVGTNRGSSALGRFSGQVPTSAIDRFPKPATSWSSSRAAVPSNRRKAHGLPPGLTRAGCFRLLL